MHDHFALMGEPRRPWIDLKKLRDSFQALSAAAHPDRFHAGSDEEKRAATRRFSEVNAAYNCLRDPKQRLRHLLELERGTSVKNVERVPGSAMDLYFQVGQLCREIDGFLAGRPKLNSPMLQLQWMEKSLDWVDRLTQMHKSIQDQIEQVLEELKTMNVHWESASKIGDAGRNAALPLDRLEQVYRLLGYFSRWVDQIQARQVQLTI